MDNNKKKKIGLKSYIGAFVFLAFWLGKSITFYGIESLLLRLGFNIFVVYLAISILISSKKIVNNILRNIKFCVCIIFIIVFGFKSFCNVFDFVFVNKNEVITLEYSLDYKEVKTYSNDRRSRNRSYNYFLNLDSNDVDLEIDSGLYYDLKLYDTNDYSFGVSNEKKEKVKIKVVYWKLSKVIDTIEIIEEE